MIENFYKSTEYARNLFKEDEKLEAIKKYAKDNNVPIITEEALSFMLFLASDNRYKKGLEIGTAIAYSTLYLSKYLDLTTIEISEERYMIAKKNLVNTNVKLYKGDAIDIIPTLDEKYDFIFIDAAKGQYMKFFELAYDKLNNGGLIFIDNILFRSYVGSNDVPKKYKTMVNKLEKFISYLNENHDFTLLPFADGIGLVRKDRNE